MNTIGIKNTSQPSFSSVNLIQISKKAFKNPDDLMEVNMEFKKITYAITEKANNNFQKLLIKLGLCNNKTFFFLEQIGHVSIEAEFAKTRGLAHYWLSQNTGIPTVKPLNPGYHSFIMLTKKEQKKANKLFNPLKMAVLISKMALEYSKMESYFKDLIIAAKLNQFFTEKINLIINGKPVHKFVVENLSELPKVFEKIDY